MNANMKTGWIRMVRHLLGGKQSSSSPVKLNQPKRRGMLRIDELEDRTMLTVYTASLTSDRDIPNSLLAGQTTGISLREAINLADAASGGSVINLTSDAYYDLEDVAPDNYTGGTVYTNTNQITGNLTINGNGATIDLSDATGQSFADVVGSANLNLQKVTIQNGYTSYGGGISITGNANATLTNVSLLYNKAVGGTAESVPGGGYTGGSAAGGGAYVQTTGQVSLNNCVLQDNSAIGGTGMPGSWGTQGGLGQGGGMYVAGGRININNTNFNHNYAEGGQTGNNGDGFQTDTDGFYALAQGGALFLESGANANLHNDIFDANEAIGRTGASSFDDHNGENGGEAMGGAIFIDNTGTANITNGSLTSNSAIGALEVQPGIVVRKEAEAAMGREAPSTITMAP